MPDDADRVTALAAIYAGTRADNSSIANVSLALLGAGAAYIAATLAFADKFGSAVSWVVVAILPSPLWLVAAFHSLLVCLSMVNAVTIQYTEEKLLDVAGVPDGERSRIGAKRGEAIGNIMIARWPHKVMEAIIYGGAGALVVGYTGYTLTLSWSHAPVSTVVFACLYGFALVSTVFSWTYGFGHAAETAEVLVPGTSRPQTVAEPAAK
ncbi:hypothetical protein [Amycolatopsis sp. NPDC004378]